MTVTCFKYCMRWSSTSSLDHLYHVRVLLLLNFNFGSGLEQVLLLCNYQKLKIMVKGDIEILPIAQVIFNSRLWWYNSVLFHISLEGKASHSKHEEREGDIILSTIGYEN